LKLAINDWRLPSYHSNNGVTKVDFREKNKMMMSYLRVTEGMMSLVQKMTQAYLQYLN
jgi:hypothetical protein